MKKIYILWIAGFLLFKYVAVFSQTNVLTQHNDVMRTGWNNTETKLNTSNVNKNSFGFLFSRPLDDQMYAQPLVVSNLNISGSAHNVVFAATVNNSVYAYDADNSTVTSPYWKINLTENGMRPPNNGDVGGGCGAGGYHDFTGKIGIVGTPVIDMATKKLFVVARSVQSNGNFFQYLHAIDITTGNDTKVLITAQVAGTGIGSTSGNLPFNPITQNQRCALLLLNGIIYIAYSSHCDTNPYHGWILGYDENTLSQKYVFVNTPNDQEGGIWMSGAGPAADPQGNIYVASGNGGGIAGPLNLENCFTRLTPNSSTGILSMSSFFIPSNFSTLDAGDVDFGPTQVLLIPNTTVALTGCKDGNLFLVDKDNMGGIGSSNNNRQTMQVGGSMHSSLGYYKGSSQEFIYLWSEGKSLEAIPFNRSTNLLNAPITNTALQGPVGDNGAFLSVSSNGAIDATAILWVSHAIAPCDAGGNTCPGILRAVSANDISTELWNSTMVSSDAVGNYAKFSSPTIANGKVYLATFSDKLMVYGLTAAAADPLPITLISFFAERKNNSTVALYWQTGMEENNLGFELQRDDGTNTFKSESFIQTKALNGNSGIPLYYQYKDSNSLETETLYRLAQVDLDGNRHYSPTVAVKGASLLGDENLSLSVIPNPAFNNMITAKYKLNIPGDVELKIMDMNGQDLKDILISDQTKGIHKYLMSDPGLQPGYYIMSFILNHELIATKKFLISK